MSRSREWSAWVEKYAPKWFYLTGVQGWTADEAANHLKAINKDIPKMANDSMRRRFAEYAQEIKTIRAEYNPQVATEGIAFPEWGAADSSPAQVPPPLGLSELPPVISNGIDIPYEDGHVWNDCHIPLHNDKLMNYSLERAKVDGVKNLYIGGDLMDMSWASRFIGWGSASPREIEQEFSIAKKIVEAAMTVFEKVYIIPGNHDGTRFKYMSHGALGFTNLMTMILGSDSWKDDNYLTIGEKRWMRLRGSAWGDWRITHPISARANPLSLAQALCLKHGENILTAHQHYLATGFDKTGRYLICDGGYMSHEELMEYKQEVDSTHSGWAKGYVELVDGWPMLVSMPD